MRHSQATEVSLALTAAGGNLVLSVADNGRGVPDQFHDGGGVAGMRERAMLIGADLQLSSAPGGGVSVTLRLPLAERRP